MPDLTNNTQPHYGWIKKGAEKQIAAISARQRLNLQGAIRLGRSIKALIHPAATINSQSTTELYARLLKQPKKKIFVICDKACYHHSRLLAQWLAKHKRLRQKFLPPLVGVL